MYTQRHCVSVCVVGTVVQAVQAILANAREVVARQEREKVPDTG